MRYRKALLVGLPVVAALAVAGTVAAHSFGKKDYGAEVQKNLQSRSEQLFGFKKPLSPYTGPSIDTYPSTDAIATARGLQASVVTEDMGRMADMMAFWPDDAAPTHAITCIEDRDFIGSFPSVQRVDLATGAIETILTGTDACDGIRRTAWGTILATEEATTGNALEIYDPLTTTGEFYNRSTGQVFQDAAMTIPSVKVIERPALGTFAYEGIGLLADGTMYAGDELRPGDSDAEGDAIRDDDGGAIYKFVPSSPWDSVTPVTTFAASPFAAGDLYYMQIGRVSGGSFRGGGQGMETGLARWAGPIDPALARSAAQLGSALGGAQLGSGTGHYRPEDLELDPTTISSDKVRFCWTNTGDDGNRDWSTVKCAVDDTTIPPMTAGAVDVQFFVLGDSELNSADNVAFQPGTGVLYVIEDHDFGDIWACLPDGADRDVTTDGCVRAMTILDEDAEPTGLIFLADGKTAYLHIQHRNDPTSPYNPGQDPPDPSTDPLIKVTGFRFK